MWKFTLGYGIINKFKKNTQLTWEGTCQGKDPVWALTLNPKP
jgi:hypothetical protein